MGKHRDGKSLELCGRIQKEFGRRLQRARRQRELMQKNLAAQMQLTRTSISNIERGLQRIYLDQVYVAAHILGVPVATLLPDVSQVITGPLIRTPADQPVSDTIASDLARVVEDLTTVPRPRSGTPRARSDRDTRGGADHPHSATPRSRKRQGKG